MMKFEHYEFAGILKKKKNEHLAESIKMDLEKEKHLRDMESKLEAIWKQVMKK